MDLFDYAGEQEQQRMAPLAARMRPRTLDEFVGQRHILGEGKLLRRAIEADQLSSLIFYGPPGTGKTTLARVIANTTKSHFTDLNAVTAGVADIRRIVDEAKARLGMYGQRTILFIDEIHRFNKAQQDALLPYVEEGTVILIGATTENPFFEVNAALLSRSQIFPLHPLTEDELRLIAERALSDAERGLGALNIRIDEDALAHLIRYADGDARRLLNALELAALTTRPGADGVVHITLDVAVESIQRPAVRYDKSGDNHYDTISAFIKSIRGSDPDAALYWLARMLDAGEDPRFIARRLVISAAEDIGNADPQALQVAVAAFHALELVACRRGASPWPRRSPTWPRRRRATRPMWPSTRPCAWCAKRAIARCPRTCATPTTRERRPWGTARATCTRTTTRAISCRSATCPRAWTSCFTARPRTATNGRSASGFRAGAPPAGGRIGDGCAAKAECDAENAAGVLPAEPESKPSKGWER